MAKWLKSNTYKETIAIKWFEVCKTFVKLDIEVLRNTMDNKMVNFIVEILRF